MKMTQAPIPSIIAWLTLKNSSRESCVCLVLEIVEEVSSNGLIPFNDPSRRMEGNHALSPWTAPVC